MNDDEKLLLSTSKSCMAGTEWHYKVIDKCEMVSETNYSTLKTTCLTKIGGNDQGLFLRRSNVSSWNIDTEKKKRTLNINTLKPKWIE